MSGCMHPIHFEHQHIVNVNALQYAGIVGSEKARILVNTNAVFSPGDSVIIVEHTVTDSRPTGNTLHRYVQYVESRIPLYLDDDAIALHLVPTKSMIDSLQKS